MKEADAEHRRERAQEEQQINAWTRWDTLGSYESVEIVRPDLSSTSLDDEVYFVVNRVINGYLNVRTIEKIPPRRFTDVRDCFFVDDGLSIDNPIAITNISILGGGVVQVTAPNHGFTNGSIVTISDVTWFPVFDANYNLVLPNQLTGNNQSAVTVINANVFTLNGVDGTGWVSYLTGGNARSCNTVFGGLYHLEGQAVSVLADGNVSMGLTVVNGSITIGYPAARVHIGLQFFSDVGTQALEAPQGSIQGKEARVPFCTVRVVNSRGWLMGQTNMDLLEVPVRNYEAISDPTQMFTGDVIVTMGSDWEKQAQTFIRQANPLPLEILDIIPAIDLED